MNKYEFSRTGLTDDKALGYDDRYLLTEEHMDKATSKLKEAVEAMEILDLEKISCNAVYDLATAVSTAASRIKKIERHEKTMNQMSKILFDSMIYGSWYSGIDIKIFLSSNCRNLPSYQSRDAYRNPMHHIDVLLNRLVINGTLKSITRGGETYYSLLKEDF